MFQKYWELGSARVVLNITSSGKTMTRLLGKTLNCSSRSLLFFIYREPSKNIPGYIRKYYSESGNGKVPNPKVKEVKKSGKPCIHHCNFKIQIVTGSTTYYELVFSDDANLPYWDPSKHVVLESTTTATEERGKKSCNTRKDKDKRQNRHTCGIFIGSVQYILGEPSFKNPDKLGLSCVRFRSA